MWWILSGLLILIAWTLKLILQGALPLWVPILATILVVVASLVLFIFQRVRAARAANALEKAIAAQGAQQALNARPERRAEIQELQKQVQTGINALKSSKLGAGKRSGAAALYSLPWYVIIGPPGAGKTTALKHSGLIFPHQDAGGGGGVRGVGGTRNCDWWFTNEAILLDTAGRYTTESDDRDEWIAFLSMLRKFRSRRPINGVLVAISVAELIDANEQQIEATGKKIRARIDEVMTQLQMVVPVYVLFTKCDLIAGFNEFFGDLRKSDRAQAWGTTLKLDMNKGEPGRIFDAEFDTLTKQVHARSLKRLAMERSREAREKIYQFPLEFSGIKRNLAELVATIFAVNSFQGTPIFRGFYFTSGTQEGRPLDRVLGRMGQAMGIRPPETAVQRVVESKSYFLHDVFMNVVFPDGDIAARSASELRRQLLMRVAVSAAAATLGVIVAIPGILSFARNRTFLRETEEGVRSANVINWADGRPASDKIVLLDPVLARLTQMDEYRDGPPLGMGWTMYRGNEISRQTTAAYVSILQQGLVIPCKFRLEDKLKRVTGDKYIKERLDLKVYLMMSDVAHLDVDWETGKLTALWAEILRPTSSIAESDLKEKLRPHVRYYLKLLQTKQIVPVPPNADVVDKARKTLIAVPVAKRYYDLFVTSLIDEKYDEAGENARANRKYPPFTLGDLFTDRPDALKALTSALYQKEKHWKEVEGPYTEKGHYAVLKNMADGAGLLEREKWVVPLGPDETIDRIPVNMRRLADDYEQQYIEQWNNWMLDLTVLAPATVKEAIILYETLSRADWPYLRILRNIQDHTQWNKPPDVLENRDITDQINQKVNQQVSSQTKGLRFNIDIKKLGDKVSAVPGVFRRTVEFAIPPSGTTGPNVDTPLAKYISKVDLLRQTMQKAEDLTPNVDARMMNEPLEDASKEAAALLAPFDDKAKALLGKLLQDPLRIVSSKLPAAPNQGTYRPGSGLKFPPRR